MSKRKSTTRQPGRTTTKKWWASLPADVECPITLEQIKRLPHAPFDLSASGAPPCYFEASGLAHYLVSQLVFEHPLSREPLPRDAAHRLDAHLSACGLPAASVAEAYDLLRAHGGAAVGSAATGGDASSSGAGVRGNRARSLQRVSAKVMRSLFAFQSAQRHERERRRGGGGAVIIDDDLAPGLRAGGGDSDGAAAPDDGAALTAASFEDAFPGLKPGAAAPPAPPAACGSFAWTSAAAVASRDNFPALPPAPARAPPARRSKKAAAAGRHAASVEIRSPMREAQHAQWHQGTLKPAVPLAGARGGFTPPLA